MLIHQLSVTNMFPLCTVLSYENMTGNVAHISWCHLKNYKHRGLASFGAWLVLILVPDIKIHYSRCIQYWPPLLAFFPKKINTIFTLLSNRLKNKQVSKDKLMCQCLTYKSFAEKHIISLSQSTINYEQLPNKNHWKSTC